MVHLIDDVTVGVVISGDSTATALRELELSLAPVSPCCLVVDMSHGPAASPELAHAVAALIDRSRRRGFSVAIVSPGAEVVRAIGTRRGVEVVATVDEALARVRGRLTPLRTIRVLDEPQAA